MSVIKKIIEMIFTADSHLPGPQRFLFNYRKIRIVIFIFTTAISIVPLAIFAVVEYNITFKAAETEANLKATNLTYNTSRFVSLYFEERKLLLKYITEQETYSDLLDTNKLRYVLNNLKKSISGVTDIGIIDSSGLQQSYVGPYNLEGKNYRKYKWFIETSAKGHFVSDVFLGYRNSAHLVIAQKKNLADSNFYIIRVTIEENFINLLSRINLGINSEALIVNNDGILQTKSKTYGSVLSLFDLFFNKSVYDGDTMVFEDKNGKLKIMYKAYIPDTPFILIFIQDKQDFTSQWQSTRDDLWLLLIVSITMIILWALGMTTFIVNRLKHTDKRRINSLKIAELENKMASIGRLAAGVAHEINNPLAIINEKAGLIKDFLATGNLNDKIAKMDRSADVILNSVDRCSNITHRLLTFSQRQSIKFQKIVFNDIAGDLMEFLRKEAEFRGIRIIIEIARDFPVIRTDKGKLLQILLNLAYNAFDAISDEGEIKIGAADKGSGYVEIFVSDNGCGIPEGNLEKIFEPFYTTKSQTGGTGLGLSIIYNLIQELGGKIKVKSKVNQGTTFFVTIPIDNQEKEKS